jgi:hypothetical protein
MRRSYRRLPRVATATLRHSNHTTLLKAARLIVSTSRLRPIRAGLPREAMADSLAATRGLVRSLIVSAEKLVRDDEWLDISYKHDPFHTLMRLLKKISIIVCFACSKNSLTNRPRPQTSAPTNTIRYTVLFQTPLLPNIPSHKHLSSYSNHMTSTSALQTQPSAPSSCRKYHIPPPPH